MIPQFSNQTSGNRTRSGFTIMELLVATAITAVLAGILLTMTNGVLRAWNRTSGSLSVNNQAQLVFDLVAEDLESTFFRGDGGVWLAATILENTTDIANRGWTTSGQFKPVGNISNDRTQDNLAACRYGLGGTWLRFFTNGIDSQPRAVAYQLARRKVTGDPTVTTNPAEIRYMLYRSEENALTTLQRGYDLDPTIPPGQEGYNHVSQNRLRVPPMSEVIANNVIDFGIRLYSRNGTVLDPVFPYSGTNWSNTATQYLAKGTPADPFPDVVDVMVRILTEEGARQIQALEAGNIPPDNAGFDQTWWRIADLHSQVFTKRIYVNTRSL